MRIRCILGAIVLVAIVAIGVVLAMPSIRATLDQFIERMTYGYVLPSNVERRIATIDGERVAFLVVHLPTTMTWRLENDPSSPKTVHEWYEFLGASLVMNGSYFTEAYQPAGYYAIDGNRNGVCPVLSSDANIAFGYTFSVWIDDMNQLQFGSTVDHPELCGGMDVVPPDTFASFPTIVKDDVSQIEKDSELKARRTMLAKTADGEKEIIITESGEITLYDVAEWLVDQDEGYEIIGNLDGGPSTGLSMANGLNAAVHVPSAVVPNVIVGEYQKLQ